MKEGAEVEYKSAKGGFPQSFWSSFYLVLHGTCDQFSLPSTLLAIPIVVATKGTTFARMMKCAKCFQMLII